MTEEQNKSQDRRQIEYDTASQADTSNIAVAAFISGMIGLASFSMCFLIERVEWMERLLPKPMLGLLILIVVLSVLAAFVLGCISLGAVVFCRNGFSTHSLGLLGLTIAVLIAVYTGIQTRNFFYRWTCGLNLEAVGYSAIVYANDHNDHFPPPDRWCDLFIEEVDGTPKMFICPGSDAVYGESSYAMNTNLAGKKIDEVPDDTVMFFETDLGKEPGPRNDLIASREYAKFLTLSDETKNKKVYKNRWNQHGGPELLTLEHRDGKGCMVLFADGHLEWIKAKDINSLRWEVP